jgi:hypothetical protein
MIHKFFVALGSDFYLGTAWTGPGAASFSLDLACLCSVVLIAKKFVLTVPAVQGGAPFKSLNSPSPKGMGFPPI